MCYNGELSASILERYNRGQKSHQHGKHNPDQRCQYPVGRQQGEWFLSGCCGDVIRVKNPDRLLVPLGSSFHSPVKRRSLPCLYSTLQVPVKPYIALPSTPWLCVTLCLDINLRISVACNHNRELCILSIAQLFINKVWLEPLLTLYSWETPSALLLPTLLPQKRNKGMAPKA